MSGSLSLLMAQINPTVGAIQANADKIIEIITTHQSSHDLIIFPELALTGYPPEDLLFRDEFFDATEEALQKIKRVVKNTHVILGHPSRQGLHRYNSASLLFEGAIQHTYHKQHLPNDGVFDEKRYFIPGSEPCLFTIKNHRFGLCICEDIWHENPVNQMIAAKAQTLISINASPFDQEKYERREAIVRAHAQRGLNVIYVNQIAGQDELLFDGQSFAMNAEGTLCARAPAFKEALQTIELMDKNIKGVIFPKLDNDALLYEGILLGLRDYMRKNSFKRVVLGLSGGIDSALTLALAVDALGAQQVHAVMMPSTFTAPMSIEDAKQQATLMGAQYSDISIDTVFNTTLASLNPVLANQSPDQTEQNIQARLRGMLLMAIANKNNALLLSTSNKSETAVGYCTIYGDMAGGLAILKDVLKTKVYDLARYRNTLSEVIPKRVLTRAPSAELAHNQTDQDTLPNYDILDGILVEYMENNQSPDAIIQKGYPKKEVLQVISMIKRNEFKRRQAPPGIKLTATAFGRDWRYPITSGF